MDMESEKALTGLRVLDFSWYIAGPLATKFLADNGATVIKVESEVNPEDLRTTSPFKDKVPGLNRGIPYASINSSKYGIALNLKHPQAITVVQKLVLWADVVVEAFNIGTTRKLGIDYERLREIKTDVIMVSHSGQGQTGFFASQPVWGFQAQALSGITAAVGWPDRKPVGTPTAYPDYPGAWMTAIAIMAALEYRRKTGKGQHVDVSQLEAALVLLRPALLNFTVNKRILARKGNSSSRAAPHGAYPCKGDDRWCVIAALNDSQWSSFCTVIGNPEWTKLPQFSTLLGRKKHEEELNKLIGAWTINFCAEDVMAKMQEAGVPAGIVQNGKDLLEFDQQLRYRHHFTTVKHCEIGELVTEVPPFHLSKTPCNLRTGGPCLGEHTEFVCTNILGMTQEDFINLYNKGVFY